MKKKLLEKTEQDYFSTLVDAEFATGWLKILIQNADYKEANRVAELLRLKNKPIISNSRLHQIEIDIWDAMLRTQTASDEDLLLVQELLDLAIDELNNAPKSVKRDIILGYAYNNLGYLLRVQGKYYGACDMYRKALPIWRELKLDEWQATTLNNLAFALAEVGQFSVAQNMAQDGYELRRKLKNLFLISLSLNTLAHIAVRENKPELAIRYVNDALRRSSQTENLRARGLSLIVGSEAYRRLVKSRDFGKINKIKYLEKALGYSKEACHIFSKKINEPERHIEALIELGCTYRDFAKYSRNIFDVTPQTRKYSQESKKALNEAIRISRSEKIIYRTVDALVNLAWLNYYLHKNVEDILTEALKEIPDNYLDIYQKGGRRIDLSEQITPYLIQLGKLYTLHGQMYFSLFNDKRRDDRDLSLEKAVRYHAIALEYNFLIGAAIVMQMRNTLDRIYYNVRKLNFREIEIVVSTLDSFEKEYHISGNCKMREFLVSHGLVE